MTWIVGGVTPFGQAFVIGDTRVTFGKEAEADLVRKVYWLGRDLAGGYAGSVRIGFHLLSHLAHNLRRASPNLIWKPEATLREWSSRAAEIFASHSEAEQKLGCSLLVSAVAPDNNGPLPRTAVITLSSPRFRPKITGRFGSLQIGSGREHETYRQWVEQYFKDPSFITRFAGWEGTIGSVVASSLSDHIRDHPRLGIGHFMHVVTCTRGAKTEAKVPSHFPDEPDPFPKVASTYEDFCQLATLRGYATASATA